MVKPKKIPQFEMDLSSKGRNSCNSKIFFLKIGSKMQQLLGQQNIQQNISKTFLKF